ncbi:unnamed protein product, partial [Discosporangium mesarthrocarpum]
MIDDLLDKTKLRDEEVRLFGLLDRLVVVGQGCRSLLLNGYAVEDKKMLVVDPTFSIPGEINRGLSKADGTRGGPQVGFRFVCVGTICPRKNQLGLIEAVAAACASHPDVLGGSSLTLIGAGDANPEYLAKLKAIVQRLNSQGELEISLAGAFGHAEVLETIVTSDAFLFNSNLESFAVAPLEAACTGIPVISTRVGALPHTLPASSTIWVGSAPGEECKMVKHEMESQVTSPADAINNNTAQTVVPPPPSHEAWGEALLLFARSNEEIKASAYQEAGPTRARLVGGSQRTKQAVQSLLTLDPCLPRGGSPVVPAGSCSREAGTHPIDSGLTNSMHWSGVMGGFTYWLMELSGRQHDKAAGSNATGSGRAQAGAEKEEEDVAAAKVRKATLRNAWAMCGATLLAMVGKGGFLIVAHVLLLKGLYPPLSPANVVTIARSFLPAFVWWRAEMSFEKVEAMDVVAYGVSFILLDIVDGVLARRSKTGPTRVGAALDVESDSLAVLYLSLAVSHKVWQGGFIAGVLRYVFVLATGARELPPSPIGGPGRFLAKYLALFTIAALWAGIASGSELLCQAGVLVLCLSFSVDFYQVFY